MTLQTKNLGLVQAIFVGSTPPSNVNMIWRDTSTIPHSFKQWDNTQSQWVSLSQNLGNSNLLQTSSLREYTIPDLGELRFKGDAIFAVGLNDENRVGEVRLHSVVQRRTAGVAISGNTSIGVIEEFTPDKMFFETRTELGNSATKKTKLELSLSSLLLEYNGVNTNSINLAEGIQVIRNGFGYKVGSDGTMLMDTTFGAKLRMENIQTLLEHKVDEGGALSMNSVANIFEDRNTVKRGLQYMADYSATLVDFSLTPKIYVDNGLSTKQNTLVSGTNIRPINGESVLGSSNLITPRLENANQTIPAATNRTVTLPADSTLAFGNLIKMFGADLLTQILPSAYPSDADIPVGHIAFKLDTGKMLGRYRVDATNYLDVSFGSDLEIFNGADVTPLTKRSKIRFTDFLGAVDDAIEGETVVSLDSNITKDVNTNRFGLNALDEVDLKIPHERLTVGDVNGNATDLTGTEGNLIGFKEDNKITQFEGIEAFNILRETGITGDKQLALIGIDGVASNLKATFMIDEILIINNTANSVTVNVGSSSGGTQVANAVVVGANATAVATLDTRYFSSTSGQNLFISSALWNSANVTISVTVKKIHYV